MITQRWSRAFKTPTRAGLYHAVNSDSDSMELGSRCAANRTVQRHRARISPPAGQRTRHATAKYMHVRRSYMLTGFLLPATKDGDQSGEEAPCSTGEGSSNEPRAPTDEATVPSEDVTRPNDQELRLPAIVVPPAGENSPFTELENLRFSSDSSEDEEHAERLPEINTNSIPLPAVLQYLRESEALANKYFSLSAKYKSKRKRHERNPTHPPTIEKIISAGDVETTTSCSVPSGKREAVMVTCDFCGKKIHRLSLLDSLNNGSDTEVMYARICIATCPLRACCVQ